MAIVTEDEWKEFKSDILEPDKTTVREVLNYMMKCHDNSKRGQKTAISRSIASVLKYYKFDDLAKDVCLKEFISKKGAGCRSYYEFIHRYDELLKIKKYRWSD